MRVADPVQEIATKVYVRDSVSGHLRRKADVMDDDSLLCTSIATRGAQSKSHH